MSEEKQRGVALPHFEGLSLCEVGWVLKSHLCLSTRRKGLGMQEMLKGCSTFSRVKEFRNLLPFPLSPHPTKAERELSMAFARAHSRQAPEQQQGQSEAACRRFRSRPRRAF